MSWIKMRTSLLTDGRVTQMSRKLSRSRHAVIGTLFEFWCLGDLHADEFGALNGWSKSDIDDHLRCPEFCDAMPSDWLEVDTNGTVKLPEYREHNGATAKTRALAQKRQKRSRESRHASVTHVSRSKRDASPLLSSSLSIGIKKGVQGETEPYSPHGENGHVLLTEQEFSRLTERYGFAKTTAGIDLVDSWIEKKPGKLAWFQKEYSSAFAVMNPKSSWVWKKIAEEIQPNKKQTNLEKAREALYGDPRGRAAIDGISGRGVLDVSGDTGTRGNLGRGAGSFLAEPTETGSETLPAALGKRIRAVGGASHQGDSRQRAEAREDDETGAS